MAYIDHSIKANRRDDGLYHAYNLISIKSENEVGIRYLYEMLEGQVAVLSSGYLSVAESVKVLDAMKKSALYREDQYSYLLYPNRQLPRFTDKNELPDTALDRSDLLKKLIQNGDTHLVEQNEKGGLHFNGAFRNADSVREALSQLAEQGYKAEVEKDQQLILAIFEEMFDHQSFTGRSGTFYGYEGLGSIYWHMVSKLLLAVGETYYRGVEEGADPKQLGNLVEHYYEIRAGIGMGKNPALYGAFPIDPYSHTPGNAGAQQPGMTGQVKEDIISRWNELGVRVKNGKIHFQPSLLRREEFLSESAQFQYFDLDGQAQSLEVKPNSLVYTYCQVPIVYSIAESPSIRLHLSDQNVQTIEGLSLDERWSRSLFNRQHEIRLVEVGLMPEL